jgi:hypothetical protein
MLNYEIVDVTTWNFLSPSLAAHSSKRNLCNKLAVLGLLVPDDGLNLIRHAKLRQ